MLPLGERGMQIHQAGNSYFGIEGVRDAGRGPGVASGVISWREPAAGVIFGGVLAFYAEGWRGSGILG
jgi:hypothetical protein